MCDAGVSNLNHRRGTVIQVEFVRLIDLEVLVALEGMIPLSAICCAAPLTCVYLFLEREPFVRYRGARGS